jgi:hypothetical protein
MTRLIAMFAAILALPCTSCGQPRRYGDSGGVPVAFDVHLDRAFVRGMRNRQGRPSVGAGASFGSGGYSSFGTGVGLSFSATDVYLLGGDGIAEGQVFRQELRWGDNAFTVPLAPGRTITLTIRVEGGREGWESIGSYIIPLGERPQVVIRLDGNGSQVRGIPPVAPAARTVAEARPSTDTGASATAASQSEELPAPAAEPAPAIQVEPLAPPPPVAPAAPYPDPALDH